MYLCSQRRAPSHTGVHMCTQNYVHSLIIHALKYHIVRNIHKLNYVLLCTRLTDVLLQAVSRQGNDASVRLDAARASLQHRNALVRKLTTWMMDAAGCVMIRTCCPHCSFSDFFFAPESIFFTVDTCCDVGTQSNTLDVFAYKESQSLLPLTHTHTHTHTHTPCTLQASFSTHAQTCRVG